VWSHEPVWSHEQVSGDGPVDQVGVLVMAHGTPAAPEELEAFFTRIRRGRPPSTDALADLRRRYDAIGGLSPLTERTRAQVDGIRHALDQARPGHFRVGFGAKHTDPGIEEGARALAASGVDRVVGLVLTPHPSSVGSGEYLERAATTLARREPPTDFVAVDGWYQWPGFVELVAQRVRAALSPGAPGRTVVIFTAHSIPERVVTAGDRYPDHVARSAALIAAAAGVDDWMVGWQSAGRTPEPWIGPDLLAMLRELAADGAERVVVCPVGFVADHLEVLYDLDIEARAVAGQVGLGFARTESLNAAPAFVHVLRDVILDADRTAINGRGDSSGGGRAATGAHQ
jgi:ferrochelatase